MLQPELFMPPYSAESEQAVIGGLLIDRKAMAQVGDVVRERDFYRRQHRLIFAAAERLDAKGEDVDLLTVIEALRSAGEQEDAGGTQYLGELAKDTPGTANIRAYAEIVRNRAIERELLQAGMSFHGIVAEPGDVSAKLDRAQQSVLDIGREAGSGPRIVRDHLSPWLDSLDARHRAGGQIVGLPTGFADLDAKLGGLRAGQFVVVAGRPSMGKTALAMQIGDAATDHDTPALVFSMEMPADELIDRQVARLGRIPMARIRSGQLHDEDWQKATDVTNRLAKTPLIIDDTPGQTITDIRARARRVKQKHGLGLVVIDYLQLMEGQGENRQSIVSDISRGCKRLAKELDVPVIALSQLNRGLEQRPNKRPRMSDLRESGAIEQDADVIAFVYRDEVYNDDSPDRGTAEIIIAKQRNGATGTVRLLFQGEFTRFENLAHAQYERMQELYTLRNRQAREHNGMEDL